MSDIAIKVENLNKSFNIPLEKKTSLRDYFLHPASFLKNKTRKFQALKDISFEIKKGEFVGIIGRNGSGKSTLLKLLSGIYEPDSGKIEINGKVVSFLELGVGFNPELSARENVYLNGTILGMGRDYIKENFEEIIEFAELENFVEMPLKNFSSGMAVRLAFAIAMKANADIYLFDEVMAVGDDIFQRKCQKYFEKIRKEKKTVILVSHAMKDVLSTCNKGILLEKSYILKIGSANSIVEFYNYLNFKENENQHRQMSCNSNLYDIVAKQNPKIESKIFIKKVILFNSSLKKTYYIASNEEAIIDIYMNVEREIESLTVSYSLWTSENIYLGYVRKEIFKNFKRGEAILRFKQLFPLTTGNYYLTIAIGPKNLDIRNYYDLREQILKFSVQGSSFNKGVVDLNPEVEILCS